MHHHKMPGRWNYGLAVILFIAGIVLFVLFLYGGLNGFSEAITQIVVPGETRIALKKTGKYTVFYEYRSLVGNKVYNTGQNVSSLKCSLISEETGSEITLSPSFMNSRYSIGSRSGYAMLDFIIQEPGNYLFSARYPEGKDGEEIVLGIVQGFLRKLLRLILTSIAIFFGAIALAVILTLRTYLKRREIVSRSQMPQPSVMK